jgi:putative glutamine amidotransferase
MNRPIIIGITDCGKYENYRRWIAAEPGVRIVKLSYKTGNVKDAEICDGIIFSGGEDLQPGAYGKPEYVKEFGLKEIIPVRDHFEFEVLEKTMAAKKPILGICRGLQLINVFLGGTLVPDIPSLLESEAHGKIGGADQEHPIRVEPGTLLYEICGQELGMVNSAHHQSAARPADALVISASGDPEVAEAMEWKDPAGKSWMLMVQWHPERMANPGSPFSLRVKNAFLAACRLS